jgi:signal transduction histidine kinase/ligand-binding sensor domain-containing protein/DNA-binding response OmpR family regulator
MLIDRDSLLWIGTNNGICSFDIKKNRFTNYPISSIQNFGKPAMDIRAIFQSSDGTLWIGTDVGLFHFDREKGFINKYSTLNPGIDNRLTNNIVTSIAENKAHKELWIGTEEGLNVLSLSTNKIIHYYADKNNVCSISDNSITSIEVDEKGNLWIGTKSGGLNLYSYSNNTFLSWKKNPADRNSLSDNYIDNLFFDNNGYLWIGTVNNGVNLIDIKPKKFKWLKNESGNPNSLSANTIRSVYEDKKGILWIGTYGGGLNRYDGKTFVHFYHQPENTSSLSHNIISALYESNNQLWIGTWGGGLCNMNLNNFSIKRFPKKVPDYINGIVEDSLHRLWLACNGGVYIYNPLSAIAYRFDNDTVPEKKLTANSVNRILWDKDGNLWVATFDGLNCVIFKNFKDLTIDTIYHFQKQINKSNCLSDSRTLCILQDNTGNIFVGTYTGGINKIKINWKSHRIRSINFQSFTDINGLAGNIVYGILTDDKGYLWISTNNGISKFDPQKNTFHNFTIDDGLQSNQFYWNAYFKGKKGIMYFGGINGLNIFHPDSILIGRSFPAVYITDFQLFNKPVKVSSDKNAILKQSILFTPQIVLKRNEYLFTIEFAAIIFSSQNKIKYAYKLENFDKNWINTDANHRYATYSHLRPGKYVFKVKSTNEDGVWNNKVKELNITVLPAPYETVWAFILYAAILLMLLYFFRSQILARARYRHEIQLQRMERKKIEEYNEMKLQFFTNVSHEFRTPLTLIIGPLEKVLSSFHLEKEVKEQLLLIKSGTKRLLQLINQLLEFRKVESGNYELKVVQKDIIPTLKEIVELFKSRAQANHIHYSASFPLKKATLFIDENILETITYNLLSNAFKFTPDGGTIHLLVDFLDRNNEKTIIENEIYYLSLKVSDTGIGIPQDKQEEIFNRFYQINSYSNQSVKGTGIGLTLCKELATIHHGNIKVESETGKGSIFTVIIGVHSSFFSEKEFANSPGENLAENNSEKGNLQEKYLLTFPESVDLNFENPETENAPTVLIIEDDIEIIKFIGKLIENQYHVNYALNGKEGFEKIFESEPDIIISDIMMPEVNGFELCEKIKTDPRISHIPIILLTALTSMEDKIKGYRIGADEYISKPFDQRHLLVTIEKLLNQRKQLRKHFQQEFQIVPNTPTLTSLDEALLGKVIKLIEENISNPELSVDDLSSNIGISTTHLYRKIKALTGFSTNDLIRKVRLKKAATLLLSGQSNISEVMYQVGFNNSSYFAKRFQEEFGMTPREYLLKNRK